MTTAPALSRADQAAESMLANFAESTGVPTSLPIDPLKIASQLGITVFVAELEAGTSAMLQKLRDRDAVIYLTASDSLNRQRFSCAHELGHYYARAGQDDEYGYIDRRDHLSGRGTDAGEMWANSFAAALLMPHQQLLESGRPYDAVALALKFGVSAEAMSYRLRNLRLA